MEITQAALSTLGTNHPLVLQLGARAQALTNYAWLADYRRLPFRDGAEDFYANDYLLFPGVDGHLDHICPEVKKTYRPYFRRALQALRTENAANAARWLGSLLHFTEDTGSPPHAAEIRGDIHTKMENWVDANLIAIQDYEPQLLGTNDEDAVEGFVRRMDGLIEFSKVRGRRARPMVEIGNRSQTKPIVLECALETCRVTADLLHTLGELGHVPVRDSTRLRGTITTKGPVGLERFPAKVMLERTSFSTLTDLSGHYEFRHLPAGEYSVMATRPGGGVARAEALLAEGRTNGCSLVLTGGANLVRNGDFTLAWVRPDAPEFWNKIKSDWEGEIVPLKPGQRYRLVVKFKEGTKGDVFVRWCRDMPYVVPKPGELPKIETRALTPKNNELTFTGTENMALFQVTIRRAERPSAVCESVSLVAVEQGK
ncbi:MAG TPA: hypothetical protein VGK40_10885 [Verrucomicrobiae bacterium]|jgi:hypothetical protein